MTQWVSCTQCGELIAADGSDHSDAECTAHAARNVSMKPLLSVVVTEAVHLALFDSVEIDLSEEQRERARWDVHAIPREVLAGIDPDALAQNVCVRLLGPGGWHVNRVYAGNATPREVFEATINRPDRDGLAELAFDLGLGPPEETQ